ncbi:MAG: hypothetical protein ACOCX9_01285 [Spirochaetota bacterium]
MKKRKQQVIDPHFQRRSASGMTAFFMLAFTIIIVLVGVNSYYHNRQLGAIAESQKEIVAVQHDIIKAVDVFSKNHSQQQLQVATGLIKKDLTGNIEKMDRHIQSFMHLSEYNTLLIVVILVFTMFQGFILYRMMIRRTHRISGPVYRLTQYTQDIIDGNYPEVRPLREDDELQEYFQLFSEMIKVLKEREDEK